MIICTRDVNPEEEKPKSAGARIGGKSVGVSRYVSGV